MHTIKKENEYLEDLFAGEYMDAQDVGFGIEEDEEHYKSYREKKKAFIDKHKDIPELKTEYEDLEEKWTLAFTEIFSENFAKGMQAGAKLCIALFGK